MKQEKKEYKAPKMKTVELEHQANLLDCSACEMGYAPHEQEPMA